jgi:adenylate cyclase
MDRNGTTVAHSRADQINRAVPPGEFDLITGTDSAIVLESETELRFVQAVHVRRDGVRYILGGTSATFTKSAMYARIAEMRERILLTGVIVSLLAISIVYLFSTKIVGIIVVLSEAARKVGEGDLKVAVVTRVKDELGLLAKEFNMMVVQIREKTEMQKFVSRAAVQMISEHKEATLGGTRRVITAMFTDIRNFTSVAETQWPEEVVVTLNHYLDVQTKLIHDCGGVVDKFIGDGIMSFFTGNDMVANSLKAAVKIQQEVDLMNKRRKKNNEIVLEIGIGISTGVAVMGSIGSADRMDYTAIGDTVNLAARLCGVAGPNEILVSETVVTRMNGKVKAVSAGKIPIKGKAERVAVFQIPSNTEQV